MEQMQLKPLKISIHKLSSGKFQTCYTNPTTSKKTRNLFKDLKSAKSYKEQIGLRFQNKGPQSLSNQPVSYLMKLHIKKCPDTKVQTYKIAFKLFMDHFGSYNVTDIETPDLREWFEKIRKERNYAERSLDSIKIHLSHFFKYLEETEILIRNPLRKILFNKKTPSKRPRVIMSVSEVKTILANLKIYDPQVLYPYIYTMAHTGARRKELLLLKREEVDFSTGLLTLSQTKTGVVRSLKMSKSLKSFLGNYLKSHNCKRVFCNTDNTEITSSGMFYRLCKFKKHFPQIKDWTMHSFRHSLAHNFLEKGGEMYQLQAILGHKNINMTIDTYGQLEAQKVTDFSPYED